VTKKLEEFFNLPPVSDDTDISVEEIRSEIELVQDAISVTEKINDAFRQIRGLEQHENEMDDIAAKAINSYEQLMSLGMNVSDVAAGKVFAEASNMLKIALEAKDTKTQRKLDQLNLMLKKARLDKVKNQNGADSEEGMPTKALDRNELLRLMRGENDK
jgi:hypothetical protein